MAKPGPLTRLWEVIMKSSMLAAVLLLATASWSQDSTTTTNCNIYGNTADCTSTTHDDRAQQEALAQAQAERTRLAEQNGRAIGEGIGNVVLHIRVHKFCKKHPGQDVYLKGSLIATCPN